ncbi:helix-turn-helix transcriptional regulator [Plantactinospora sp. B5E13]|uniref:helix-turn-helix domain-containing protein n=1 Tax=Plantactinospora sp. B5E13 TaxID=3153758 RepID=UPI00325E86DD
MKYLRAAKGGLTQERVAEQLNVSTSLIAKFETARLVPVEDTARSLDEFFGSGDLIQGLALDVRKMGPPEWFRPWPELERDAASLRSHEPTYVPGLLQTEAYARAVLAVGLHTPDEVERHLAIRLERQTAVFGQEKPPVCTFTVDECALLRGDQAIMREQLAHLAQMSRQPRLSVHVVPRSAGFYAGLTGNFVLASVPGEGEVAYLEDPLDGKVITDPDRLAAMARTWEAIRSVALPRDLSRDLILRMASEL